MSSSFSASHSSSASEPPGDAPAPAVFAPYAALLGDLQRLGEGLDRLHAQHLSCRQGCSACCHQHLGVFSVEADTLTPVMAALPSHQRDAVRSQALAVLAGTREACPLLIDDSCSVYASRPVICRTHGYPLHYELTNEPAEASDHVATAGAEASEGEIVLDVCPLNFTAPGAIEGLALAQTLPLDRLNLRLTAINYVYCRDERGDTALADRRIPLAELAMDAITGSASRPDTLDSF